MSRLTISLIVLVCSLALALGVFLYRQFASETYYAVYLETGDLYFGKISRFPRLALTEAWFLERGAAQESIKLARFDEAFWQPRGTLLLNNNNIVWMAPLAPGSRIIDYMKNPASQEPPRVDASLAPPGN
ncbi:hypothetical protein HY504_00895 [Candidatus Wolfebacteria bacterium]|nr:hypothetical protein [Candidatus Wolfebacteria bacterium]